MLTSPFPRTLTMSQRSRPVFRLRRPLLRRPLLLLAGGCSAQPLLLDLDPAAVAAAADRERHVVAIWTTGGA